MALSVIAPPTSFLCPGETLPVVRAVHLARQEAGFPACRRCPFRDGSRERPAAITASKTLCRPEGFRGIYRNELGDEFADRLGTAFAALLWGESASPASERTVVVAYDERPWSPRLAMLAGEALRRSGCATIDAGMLTGPQFRQAVATTKSTGGVYATGVGGGPAMAGFDLALAGGRPLSTGGTLDRLSQLLESNTGRMTRSGAACRQVASSDVYDEFLFHNFESGAAVPGIVGTSSAMVRDRVRRLGGRTGAAGLRTLELPRRSTTQADRDGFDSLADLVQNEGAGFGFWIDEAGTTFRALDERGNVVPIAHLAGLLLTEILDEHPTSPVAVDWKLGEQLENNVLRRREVVRSNGTAEAMFLSVRDHAAIAGADSAGRFWLREPSVGCDALFALGRLRRMLAGGNEPLSQRIKAVARPA